MLGKTLSVGESSCRSEALAFEIGKPPCIIQSSFPISTRDLKPFEERHIVSIS